MSITTAIDALRADGYDTHETAIGTIYIARMAPDSADYGDDTSPGSDWDEECEDRLATIAEIVKPHGCVAEWSDNDIVIAEEEG